MNADTFLALFTPTGWLFVGVTGVLVLASSIAAVLK